MKVDRRQMLVAGIVTAAAGTLSGADAGASARLVLLDPALGSDELGPVHDLVAANAVELQADFVRQWRDQLHVRARTAGMEAYLRWDKAVLLAGLAREANLSAARRRLGKGVFFVSLAIASDHG